MLRLALGTVVRVIEERPGFQLIGLRMAETGLHEEAMSFAQEEYVPGDKVIVNTTAVHLKLGTGGYHVVVGKADRMNECDLAPTQWGHIMKMRYSPWQLAVDSVEEQASPHHDLFLREDLSLEGTPVLITELHSLLPVSVIAWKQKNPESKIVYVMPDGASLPLALSRHVHQLKRQGFLHATITTGHAWGGDHEAVTIHSGLLAARHVEKADLIICTLGPGVAGTGTSYAFSGIQLAEVIHAVSILGGFPLMIPRISFADSRQRHYGISHHTQTILQRYALRPVVLTMPLIGDHRDGLLEQQVATLKKLDTHRLVWGKVPDEPRLSSLEQAYGLSFTTMGRTWVEDPVPFQTAVLAIDLLCSWREGLAKAFTDDPHCFDAPNTLAALDLFSTRTEAQP
ncbi:DUF3866 family protein [Brevibacillus nitrificans]|uniref:DUF3866 family protein n=1 Tax=Brevibacillus nitrificans TaxID=651560 RepID=UPI002E1F7176|nr:DUF3866 family protein [Brevibacillus nitrificans]